MHMSPSTLQASEDFTLLCGVGTADNSKSFKLGMAKCIVYILVCMYVLQLDRLCTYGQKMYICDHVQTSFMLILILSIAVERRIQVRITISKGENI